MHACTDRNLPLPGELDGVAQEVGQYLPHATGIAAQPPQHIAAEQTPQLETLLLGLERQQFHCSFHNRYKVEVNTLDGQFARFDLREIQDVVDDGQERVPRPADDLCIFTLFRGEFCVEQQTRHADDAVHGGANFMAHVGNEFRFEP